MSVQFGAWNFDGKPLPPENINQVSSLLAPYGPDSSRSYQQNGITILWRAFHTTREARHETQPHIDRLGAVLTWDGRLDNRHELIRHFRNSLPRDTADVSIVAAAFTRWGTGCFAKLVGDWALSLWIPSERRLLLAKDPIGTRHLFYVYENTGITWCTILDPLVLVRRKALEVEQEYIAGWLSTFPAPHLTPYVGIRSVAPATYVCLEPTRHSADQYWSFDPGKTVRYRTDEEYEEHFRAVFADSVERRLRSDSPILAELSGGMDSSAIVCTADALLARGHNETPRLDTVSYFDDSEPNWNERPYFTKVEEKRGRSGCHIDASGQKSFDYERPNGIFTAIPGSLHAGASQACRDFSACLESNGNRVVLSGIGGDEVLGGLPTATPELMDLLAMARFGSLAHQLKAWALAKKKPWFFLLGEALRAFIPSGVVGARQQIRPPSWLDPNFARRHRAALAGYACRIRLRIPPSFQENVSTLGGLTRQLACSPLSPQPLYEKRYPFLDRDLLEFLFAIPRNQLVRPGERRSLMRRSLVGIVPDEVLGRRRKAYVVRSPMTAVSDQWISLIELTQNMVSSALGIIDARAFRDVLEKARQGQEVMLVAIERTLEIEFWLRGLTGLGIVNVTTLASNLRGTFQSRTDAKSSRAIAEFS
jgi:asparagine synthase (glutamine-hydrolysing)